MKLIIALMTGVVCVQQLRRLVESYQEAALLRACLPARPRVSHQRAAGRRAKAGVPGATQILSPRCCCVHRASSPTVSLYPGASLWGRCIEPRAVDVWFYNPVVHLLCQQPDP